MKYFKIYFHGSRDPMVVLGRTQSQVSRDYKEIFGNDAIDEVEPVSREDTESQYGDDYDEIVKFNTRTEGTKVSVLTGYNPFVREIEEEKSEIKITTDGKAEKEETKKEEGSETKDDVQIDKDSPDANKDGKVDEKDDLNKDGKVDKKDLKIAELEKDLRIRQLEKDLEEMDDPAPEEKMKEASRLRLKDRGTHFEAIDDSGTCIKKFKYDNESKMARAARYEGQRFIERHYKEQLGESVELEETYYEVQFYDKNGKPEPGKFSQFKNEAEAKKYFDRAQKTLKSGQGEYKINKVRGMMEAKVTNFNKIDKKVIDTLKSMDTEEAMLIIQGLPKNLQRQAKKALGIKETVDGRTKAYKETAARLMTRKESKTEIEEEQEMMEAKDDLPWDSADKKGMKAGELMKLVGHTKSKDEAVQVLMKKKGMPEAQAEALMGAFLMSIYAGKDEMEEENDLEEASFDQRFQKHLKFAISNNPNVKAYMQKKAAMRLADMIAKDPNAMNPLILDKPKAHRKARKAGVPQSTIRTQTKGRLPEETLGEMKASKHFADGAKEIKKIAGMQIAKEYKATLNMLASHLDKMGKAPNVLQASGIMSDINQTYGVAARSTDVKELMDKAFKKVGLMEEAELDEAQGPCWDGYEKVPGKKDLEPGSCRKVGEEEEVEEKNGLWANIHAKRKRGEKPAKPGDDNYPTDDALKKSQTKKEEVKEAGYNDSVGKDYGELAKDVDTAHDKQMAPVAEASVRQAFVNAARKAKAEGKKTFIFNEKEYPCTIKEAEDTSHYADFISKTSLIEGVEKVANKIKKAMPKGLDPKRDEALYHGTIDDIVGSLTPVEMKDIVRNERKFLKLVPGQFGNDILYVVSSVQG